MKWPETSLFRRVVYITCIIEKLIIPHQEPIEGIKVWILSEYPSNILGYPSKCCNYTSKKKVRCFPHSPRPPKWITFLIFIPQKILLNIKDSDFRIGCILVLFLFSWIINVQFTYFRFLNFLFKICDMGLLWSKITIFIQSMDEISPAHTGWACLTQVGQQHSLYMSRAQFSS